MAKWPTVSPVVLEDVNQNPDVIDLVSRMIEVTHDYVQEWDQELSDLHNTASKAPLQAITELANSVQLVVKTLQEFRDVGIEMQTEGLATFLENSEKALQEMADQADNAGKM